MARGVFVNYQYSVYWKRNIWLNNNEEVTIVQQYIKPSENDEK